MIILTLFFMISVFFFKIYSKLFSIVGKYVRGTQFKTDKRLEGKIVIVTGANTGIGYQTAIDLARRGAKVYMACRNYERGEKARKEIMDLSGSIDVYNRLCDLGSLESIRNFAKSFLEEENRLDILINNAGTMSNKRSVTKDGFEEQLGVAHLGHFLLTNLLLDLLKRSAPSRIVVVSGNLYKLGAINKEDFNSEQFYSRIDSVAQSALARILFAHELSKRLEGTGVTVNSLHPGLVKTQIMRNFPRPLYILIKPFEWLFFKSAEDGIDTVIKVAIDPDLEKVSGKFFDNCKQTEVNASARNDEVAAWLWNKSEEMTKLNSNSSNDSN